MSKKKILFIEQEIYPYVPKNYLSDIGRNLPQAIQEHKREIRTFMPKFGVINERRNQLHEVIRLSGMNLVIDNSDHSLIIKVASISSARMQVYFIDNEDFFQKKQELPEVNDKLQKNSDERSIFFIRGVLETVKKLRWIPDIIHCNGWMTALAPIFVKKGYADDPVFHNSKIVYSIFNDRFKDAFPANFPQKLQFEGINDEVIKSVEEKGPYDYDNLTKLALDYSDGAVLFNDGIDSKITDYAKEKNLPLLGFENDFNKMTSDINSFYDTL